LRGLSDYTSLVTRTSSPNMSMILTATLIGFSFISSSYSPLIALKKAVETVKRWRVDVIKTYFHQDQGSVFKAYEYVGTIVKTLKATISFSRVATPQDNPEMEVFFGRLKDEWKKVFYEAKTEDEVIGLISQAITYCNTIRIHSAHKNMSPDEFLKDHLPVKN